MTRVRVRVFAFAGLGLAIAGAVGAAVVRIVSPAPFIGGFGFNAATMIGYAIQGVTWASIGALLVVRRPGNGVGWLMVPIGVGYAVSQFTVAMTFSFAAEGTPQGDRLAQIAGWVTVLLQLVTVLQFAVGFLFPTGRAQSPVWARFVRGFWAFAVVFVVFSLFQPGPLQLIPALDNPFGFGPDLRGGRLIAPVIILSTVIVFVCVVISMVSRYTSAERVQRQQLKWFVLALSLSAIALGLVSAQAIATERPAAELGLTVFVCSGTLVPLAIGIAILRHHLYDIDRIISRTLGYAVVTATLAAVFGASALILGAVLGSQGAGETFQIAGATLLVLALFSRVRRRAQSIIDRRFDRSRYDADLTVSTFAARLRGDLDLGTVHDEIVGTATSAVRPTTASVWLRGTGR